jgi:transaldolase
MKIFIDTGDPEVADAYHKLGLIHGVTTNPEIMAIDAISDNPFDLLRKLIKVMGDDYVFAQVLGLDLDTQLKEAKVLFELGPNMVIKVIMDKVGLKSIPMMVKAGIMVSATAVNTIGRAILAAECGAHYMIPYYGYLEDAAESSTNLVRDVGEIYKAQGYATKMHIYCRRVEDIKVAAKAGAWGVLLPPQDLERFFNHAQTEIAVNGHRTAWRRRYGDKTWLDFVKK